jgi:hypothetical protein
MTICCRCGRHYWPGKKECPGAATSDGCNHIPCENCEHYIDKKEKEYGRAHTVARDRKEKSNAKRK